MQDPRMALVEKKYHKAEGSIPEFRPGDTVKVHVKVVEGNRSRIQVFEGVVIGRQHGGLRENFIVRKISNGVGVERIFPVHCPSIDKIEVVRKGRVRRAKLYYLRKLSGKAARIKERKDFEYLPVHYGKTKAPPQRGAFFIPARRAFRRRCRRGLQRL